MIYFIYFQYSFENKTNENEKLSFLYKLSVLDDLYVYIYIYQGIVIRIDFTCVNYL